MSRFDQEWAVVPRGARWTAVVVALAVTVLMAGVLLVPSLVERDPKALLVLAPFFLLTLLGAVAVAIYVLLLGYVYGDARRRGMNRFLWTLLALFIPYAVGIILYFVLREPVLVPCPSCGTPARKGHAYCASCGTAVRTICPNCRQPVEAGWRNCALCGHALHPQEAGPQASTGA
jgi:hypothetical protein